MPWIRAECSSSVNGVWHQLAIARVLPPERAGTMMRFERHGDRSAWKDCTELENEHEIGLRATKTALRSMASSAQLGARNSKKLVKPI